MILGIPKWVLQAIQSLSTSYLQVGSKQLAPLEHDCVKLAAWMWDECAML